MHIESIAILARVRPVRLPAHHPLARPRNEQNRGIVQPVTGPPAVVDGKGAGRWPTSESVFSDVLDLYRLRCASPPPHAGPLPPQTRWDLAGRDLAR